VTVSIYCDVTHCCPTADQPTPICRAGGCPRCAGQGRMTAPYLPI
jgi:hypothetical protein